MKAKNREMNVQNAAYVFLGAFVDELARCGVRDVCICPGSRSTPLAMMFVRHPDVRIWMHIDERSAAFFALGMAKARRLPVALLCTSGTAAANFLPAVVEARYARVPLIVITADRPHELRDVGAPQTIDQLHLYGPHAKWFVEMAVPEASPGMLRYVRTMAGRAAATARTAPSGPVHLNFPLREPLVPLPPDVSPGCVERSEGRPYVTVTSARRQLLPEQVHGLADLLSRTPRGLIVSGPQDDPGLAASVAALAKTVGYPILADPLSQIRCGPHDRSFVVDAYDAFLRIPQVADSLRPDIVLRLGAVPTSKPLVQYLERHRGARHIVLDGGDGWNEPTLLAADVLHADPTLLCAALVEAMGSSSDGASQTLPAGTGNESVWTKAWHDVNRQARHAIEVQLAEFQEAPVETPAEPSNPCQHREMFEGQVFAELAGLLPDGATLFVGSSMPVRDLDTFFPTGGRRVRFLANRGANGIDGVVSTALGASAVTGGKAGERGDPLLLVIGDLSFYHDLNGLLAAKLHKLNITIVLVNNDGGGIFSFLPQAEHPEYFETLFGTPLGIDFRPVVEMYGGTCVRAETWDAFRDAVRSSIPGGGLTVVEVRTRRQQNVTLHRKVWSAVAQAVKGTLQEVG